MILAITVPMVLAAAGLMFAAAWAENRRDDRASGNAPGPRHPVTARVTRAARHVHSLACRLPGASSAFPSPPAAAMVAGENPAQPPLVGHETAAAGALVPGRDSPGTSPDVTGEHAPAGAPAAVAPPAGDLSNALAGAGELVTHPDPALWKGRRNIAPWFLGDGESPWADEPGTFTASIARDDEAVA